MDNCVHSYEIWGRKIVSEINIYIKINCKTPERQRHVKHLEQLRHVISKNNKSTAMDAKKQDRIISNIKLQEILMCHSKYTFLFCFEFNS